jgi:predicted nucleic acid-binding protein
VSVDSGHSGGKLAHDHAHRWFASTGATAWATCPIIENGVIWIVGYPRYHNSPGPPVLFAEIVAKLRALPLHVFWPDDFSMVRSIHLDFAKIWTSAQATDAYLLALGKAHGDRLASFDRKPSPTAVKHGKATLQLIAVRWARRLSPM